MGKAGIEEVEAYGDDDQNLDIDVALSYIDERIQNVLGHYQKEFEDGASAENLGARFGGYGSFLPTYQRSPSISSNPRTKQKVQNHNTPGSPQYFPSKDVHYSAVVSVEAQPLRPGPVSNIMGQMPLSRTSVVTSVNSQSSDDHVPQCKTVDLPMLQTDRKPLKVRIKLGSKTKLAQQNAAIYSGLGLGMSPCSSPEDSPTEWEENFPGSQETECESPSFIVKIMTSFPVPDGALLTPLHECFVRFVEEKSLLVDSKSGPVQERSSYSNNKIASVSECKEEFGVKKIKLGSKKERLLEWNNENYMDHVTVINAHQEKEVDSVKSKPKEISSNSLKFTVSIHKNKASCLAEGTGEGSEANIGMAMDRIVSSNVEKWETAESVSNKGRRMIDKCNAKTSFVEKVQKNKRVGQDLRKGAKSDKYSDLVRADCDNFKGFKHRDGGSIDPSGQKCDRKVTSHFQDESKVPCLKKLKFTGGGNKSKGKLSDGGSAAGLSKGSLRDDSSMLPKKNLTRGSHISSKNEGDDNESQKEKDSYSVLNRNKKLGHKVNKLDLLENPAKDCTKASNLVISGKANREVTNMSDERSGDKSDDHPLMSNTHTRGDVGGSALAITGPNSDVLPTGVTPVFIQENWVGCDKCHKWRLLPYGSNPDHLPKKWKCKLLNWLPGMNKCSFSEEETTNALNALYLVPIAGIQNNQQIHTEGAASQTLLAGTQQLDQNRQGLFEDIRVPSGGKKKHESKAVSNAAGHSESINLLKSEKNNDTSVKSLKNANQLSLELKSEKRSGDAKPSKTKRRRESDQDEFRVTIEKTDHMHCTDKYQYPSGFSTREAKIQIQNHTEMSFSQDLKGLAKRGAEVSTKKQKNQLGRASVMDEHNNRIISGKKRKLKDMKETQIHPETLLCNEHHYRENWISTNRTSGNELRKEKAAKEPKLRDKDFTGKADMVLLSSRRDSPVDGKITVKERSLRQHEGNKCQLIVDGMNSVRRGLPVAANASSLKISISTNINSNIQDIKGSPVESVSSSPMRFSISDNLRRNLLRKGDALNAHSPPIYSEGKDNGGSPKIESVRNEKFFSDIYDKYVKSFSNHENSVTEHTMHGKVESSAEKSSNYSNHKTLNVFVDDSEPDNQSRNKMSAKKPRYDAENVTKQFPCGDGNRESLCVVSRHPAPNSRASRNTEAPISIKNNLLTRAANNALREAKDLEHSADRLKVSGSGLESTVLFFQAALKFLHGALLLEPCNSEAARYGEMTSATVYASTAKLCEYCAHEFERCKDMASAALAYKCVEVASMRLIYSNDLIARRDQHELQMALQMVPSVESPSSSASDVDNVNNQAAVDGAYRVTDISPPTVSGNHVIAARNRPSFLRLLNFTQDVNLAMEASRKSLDAYEAAYLNLAEGGNKESLSSVKRVLDVSFHDLEGLIHLIRLAMEALSS